MRKDKKDYVVRALAWDKMVRETNKEEIKNIVKNSKIFEPVKSFISRDNRYNTRVLVTQDTSIDAIFKVANKENICVLNFASYRHNANSGYFNGSFTQEESLYHYSDLSPVLSDGDIENRFYLVNNNDGTNSLYSSRLLYSPNVNFYLSDFDIDMNNHRTCDVITCAAPNKRGREFDAIKNDFSDEDVENAMNDRIMHILYAASEMGAKTLILGAFGCGMFRNDVEKTAQQFNNCIYKYFPHTFETILFPIPDYSTFKIFRDNIKQKY